MMWKAWMMGRVGRGMRPLAELVLEAQDALLSCHRGSGVLGMGRGLPGVALCGSGEPQSLYLTLTETGFLQEQRCPCSPLGVGVGGGGEGSSFFLSHCTL